MGACSPTVSDPIPQPDAPYAVKDVVRRCEEGYGPRASNQSPMTGPGLPE